jgi:hypothetical protein
MIYYITIIYHAYIIIVSYQSIQCIASDTARPPLSSLHATSIVYSILYNIIHHLSSIISSIIHDMISSIPLPTNQRRQRRRRRLLPATQPIQSSANTPGIPAPTISPQLSTQPSHGTPWHIQSKHELTTKCER